MRFGFQRREAVLTIPDLDPLLCSGRHTPREYRKTPVRMFNEALLRGYALMRATQSKTVPVWLPADKFPLTRFPEFQVSIEHAQDDAHARVFCEDRVLNVYPVSTHVMGLCPHTHGGRYLGLEIIYTFIAGA